MIAVEAISYLNSKNFHVETVQFNTKYQDTLLVMLSSV